MKKILLILSIVILSTACNNHIKAVEEIPIEEQIPVDPLLEFLFDRFILLMEENDIEIDYSKITSIGVLPLKKGLNGMQKPTTSTITLSYFIKTPVGTSMQAQNDFIFYVLAHEIGHSQGFGHSKNAFDLMYPTSEYAMGIITTIGIEEYILDAYQPVISK